MPELVDFRNQIAERRRKEEGGGGGGGRILLLFDTKWEISVLTFKVKDTYYGMYVCKRI